MRFNRVRSKSRITTIAVAPSNRNTLYIGTDDGNVWLTRNGGSTYTRVDSALPDLWVTRTAVDPSNDAIAYATFALAVGMLLFQTRELGGAEG